jgi:hypothetical protein
VQAPSRQDPQEALVSQQLPPDVRHVLILVAPALGVLLCTLGRIEKWWHRSYVMRVFRAHPRVVRWHLTYPFGLLRKQSLKTTAGAGASPTPAPAVPHPHDDAEGEP